MLCYHASSILWIRHIDRNWLSPSREALEEVSMSRPAKPARLKSRDPGSFKGLLIRMNVEGWRALRILAAETDTTLNALAIEALNDLLKKHGKRPSIPTRSAPSLSDGGVTISTERRRRKKHRSYPHPHGGRCRKEHSRPRPV